MGGGFLMVPLQVMWTHTDPRRASGTSLAAIVPVALAGACVYYFGNGAPQVDLTVALLLVLGGGAGAFAGAYVARRIPERALRVLVALLLVVVGLKQVYDAALGASGSPGGLVSRSVSVEQYAFIILSGLVIGILSGLAGVGGGILTVPTLVLGFGLAQRMAQGTSLVAILPTAAIGALTHYRHGDVDLRSVGWIAGAGVPATLLGAALAIWMPQRMLAGVFGLFVLVAATRMWPRR
ncbi:sulfite exporter TauE/SafE family protein [bacterium]|nr:MAG: sulfite exporter TauE/SafE family protein [bacterium]